MRTCAISFYDRQISLYERTHNSVRINVVDQRRLMNLAAARQHRRHRRNANTATGVAHQVENTGRISHLLVWQRSHGHGRQRNEDKAHRKPADDVGPHNTARRHHEIDIAELIRRITKHQEPKHHEVTPIDFANQASDENHGTIEPNPRGLTVIPLCMAG